MPEAPARTMIGAPPGAGGRERRRWTMSASQSARYVDSPCATRTVSASARDSLPRYLIMPTTDTLPCVIRSTQAPGHARRVGGRRVAPTEQTHSRLGRPLGPGYRPSGLSHPHPDTTNRPHGRAPTAFDKDNDVNRHRKGSHPRQVSQGRAYLDKVDLSNATRLSATKLLMHESLYVHMSDPTPETAEPPPGLAARGFCRSRPPKHHQEGPSLLVVGAVPL